MVFKSEAQRKKLERLVKEGRLHKSIYDAFAAETGSKPLPEKAPPKNKMSKRQRSIRTVKVIK
jgi:hypothetical protein